MKPFDISSPCEQGQKHITEQQAHRYLGFRTLHNFKILNSTGNGTAMIINNGATPLELGDAANLQCSRCNVTPVPRPAAFLTAVHMDIGYGDCVAIGGSQYTLMLVNHTTRFCWILYSMRSLTHDNIITALETFKIGAGTVPETFYTDFDPKLIKGKTAKLIHKEESQVHAAPPAHQDKNGLIERNWNVAVDMARAYLTDAKMP
jgi:hypothetical protein